MSDFYNKYPYTDFHELNLDWIIERVKQLTADWLNTKQAWENTEADWQELYNYVHDYFDNLDVQDEINAKINAMILDGSFATIVTPIINAQVADTVAAWLAEHITPTSPVVDDTLTISGAAADAKVTGTRITDNDTIINLLSEDTSGITFADGYYTSSGTLVSGSQGGGHYSNVDIKLKKGFSICLKASGYNENVCMIGTSRSGTTAITPLVISTDSNVNLYTYTATNDINVRISYIGSTPEEIVIVSNADNIADLIETMPHTARVIGSFYNSASAGVYDDVNALPSGSIATYRYTPTTNAPTTSFTGSIFTMGGIYVENGGQFVPQIAIDRYGNMWIRGRYADYTSWYRVFDVNDNSKDILTLIYNHLQYQKTDVDFTGNTADGYFDRTGDLNRGSSGGAFYTPNPTTIKAGQLIKITAAGYQTNMSLMVNGSAGNGNTLVQCSPNVFTYYYLADEDMPVRFCCLNAYSDIFKVEIFTSNLISDIYAKVNNYDIAAFRTMGVCGDSLSSGECAHNEGGSVQYTDLYDFSWLQYIGRKTGNKAINFSAGGLNTRSWLTDSHGLIKLQNPDNKCLCYYIALGVNDVNNLGSEYLGTISDVDTSDPTQSADTFYGNYAKIIGYIRSVQPKAVIFGITMPNFERDSLVGSFNTAIADVCQLLNCELITLTWNDYAATLLYRRYGHYNATGYNKWAEIIMKHTNDYMKAHPDKFQQIEFIGTNYSWNS